MTWRQGQQVRPENKTIKTDNSSTPLSPLLIGMHTHPHTEAHIHSSISTTLTNQLNLWWVKTALLLHITTIHDLSELCVKNTCRYQQKTIEYNSPKNHLETERFYANIHWQYASVFPLEHFIFPTVFIMFSLSETRTDLRTELKNFTEVQRTGKLHQWIYYHILLLHMMRCCWVKCTT